MTKLEQVAKALFDHNQSLCNLAPEEWKYVGLRGYWYDLARAALEAMREPTPEMITAGAGGDPAFHTDNDKTQTSIAWNVMIDAALKD